MRIINKRNVITTASPPYEPTYKIKDSGVRINPPTSTPLPRMLGNERKRLRARDRIPKGMMKLLSHNQINNMVAKERQRQRTWGEAHWYLRPTVRRKTLEELMETYYGNEAKTIEQNKRDQIVESLGLPDDFAKPSAVSQNTMSDSAPHSINWDAFEGSGAGHPNADAFMGEGEMTTKLGRLSGSFAPTPRLAPPVLHLTPEQSARRVKRKQRSTARRARRRRRTSAQVVAERLEDEFQRTPTIGDRVRTAGRRGRTRGKQRGNPG